MIPKSRATLKDVAKLAQVSAKSVSRVINNEGGVSEETRQRILAAVSELGYVTNTTAKNLRGGAAGLGLIVSGFEDYAGQIIRGMSQAAQHLGYNLVLYVQHGDDQPIESYRALLGSGLIGGLLMVVPYDYERLTDLCGEYHLPYVLVDYEGRPPEPEVPTVSVTNRKGMLEATRYLVALGHRRIGFITGLMSMASARERLQGYQEALAEIGLTFDPSLVAEGQWTRESGFAQTQILMHHHPDLSAIIASDDLMALGASDAVKESHLRVGEDISIIGFDDIPSAASAHPPLTTVRQPMPLMGQASVELLAALLEGRPLISLRREFPTELIIRQSTARYKDRA
ncbi:MAG: LacI family DNA-binding transcriptional regulator [Anaerolineae bacterium]|nr:LacI family DNA-binding transcriptional regulator [Anaerolineae bacterium]